MQEIKIICGKCGKLISVLETGCQSCFPDPEAPHEEPTIKVSELSRLLSERMEYLEQIYIDGLYSSDGSGLGELRNQMNLGRLRELIELSKNLQKLGVWLLEEEPIL